MLDVPLEEIPRVSKKIIPALKRLGIKTAADLLYHFPARYEDFSNKKPISGAAVGEITTITGTIRKIGLRRTAIKKMALVEAVVEDATGKIKALWFNQPFLARTIKAGHVVNLSGKVALGPGGPYLQNPAYEKVPSSNPRFNRGQVPSSHSIHTGRLVPIYPETAGITSRWIRFLVKFVLDKAERIPDSLPPETLRRQALMLLADAFSKIHFPKTLEEAEKARRRLTFEKLLLFQLRSLRERSRMRRHRAPAIALAIPVLKEFVSSLPFDLTDAQRRAIWEIAQDIAKSRPMNRLLEGDVGSGKTVVAAAAALLTVKSGFRAAFMAPTEILARQHRETLARVLARFRVRIGILTGSAKEAADAQIIVGTHALIQKNVRFGNLGLVVIDEQHRFGVEQRARIANPKAQTLERDSSQLAVAPLPHFLSMTATPIPRTLALALYGDLDLSILDEMPPTRKEIITKIVHPSEREAAYRFVREEAARGRQVFVVCPRIDAESVNAGSQLPTPNSQLKLLTHEVKAVKQEYEKLSKLIFPDLRVAMLHGKMKPKEKDSVMKKFRERKTDILVSTSVIEVGVDIPNASIMVIEGAERFGLAQLHQFRGRVGRGAEQSHCLLFPTEDGLAARRLQALVDSASGFELAERDLEIRGAGEIFGSRQWGDSDIPYELLADSRLIRDARSEAIELVRKSPDLSRFPELAAALRAFEQKTHLE